MAFIGSLRRAALTPDTSETRMSVRGFHTRSEQARDLLETIGRTFLEGYGEAAEARRVADTEPALERIPTRFRGFAYEGAAMGLAVRDCLPFGGGRVKEFLAGPGNPHIYMAYVGIGWAMARLPRFRWSRLYAPDPLLRWLVLDGYGFHQAYFHTHKYVIEQFRHKRFPWPVDDDTGYATRVIDQGIGRALWFVGGTDVLQVTRLVEGFAESRRADLYSGVGLAATYAGGADETELRELWRRAASYRTHLAQGAAFAAAARVRAGLVVPHVELATGLFCDLSPADAAAVTDRVRPGLSLPGEPPMYEIWRNWVRDTFVVGQRARVANDR
ncbi:DUF1702 family protein [Micromonospora lutea]|uniref:Enediyne biosynthesis protein n=1 Tax=Micromonospora lutea TaxID=419825 RepID=A0ABQ4IYH7_9ACTN|nr:DUF1702 family protein [Micromonospora lutea]GIJ22960.1 enediyne biosynthesis protein [Micromonospora lutea]